MQTVTHIPYKCPGPGKVHMAAVSSPCRIRNNNAGVVFFSALIGALQSEVKETSRDGELPGKMKHPLASFGDIEKVLLFFSGRIYHSPIVFWKAMLRLENICDLFSCR